MSETEGGDPGDRRQEVQRWLAIVREDIDVAVAAAGLTPPRYGAAGYPLQQTAEKIVKALLVLAGEPFRHTHDLDYLVARAVPFHPDLGDILEQFRPLSIWSVAFRCPAIDDATSDQDLRATPSNHFEKLRGNLAGFHSIRVNRQWRLIFLWDGGRGEATGLYLDDHSYL